jgi:Secretion system C-terminal sorting domain
MKTNLLFIMLLISIRSFSQECPCVKTAIIGTDAKASTIHNNKLVVMDNVTIKLGESINLSTKENTGKVSWFKDGKLIENTLVSPKETTEYAAKSTLNGCPEIIAKVQVKVDKSSNDLNNAVAIYPNPTDDYVTISANNKEIKSIQINNLVGGKLKTFQFDNNLKHQTLNFSDLTTGVYIVIIEVEGNNTITKKLIKN